MFRLIVRKNTQTGLSEEYVQTDAKVISLESTSRETVNGKKYGFFTAEVDGRVSSGIAYNAVVEGRDINPGDRIKVEVLKEDALQGFNNRWKISLLSAEELSSNITDFLKGL